MNKENTCPQCNFLISDDRYNYCPYCGHTIRELEVICPEKVYAGAEFSIICKSVGEQGILLESLSIDAEDQQKEPVTIIKENPKCYDHAIIDPGDHTLIVKTPGKVIKKIIKCSKPGSFSLIWQNIKEIDLTESRELISIPVSLKTPNHWVILSLKTKKWFTAQKILITVGNKEYDCVLDSHGFKIPDRFFPVLKAESQLAGKISITSDSNHTFQIENLLFTNIEDLPVIKMKAGDYVNQGYLSDNVNNILYTLSYEYDQEHRPINEVEIRYQSSFIDDHLRNIFFDENQKIMETVTINIDNASRTVTHIGNNIINRLEFNVVFCMEGSDVEFCIAFDIPFRIRDEKDPPPDPNRIVAFDFGTSNTCIAYYGAAEIELFTGINNTRFIPTILKFHDFSLNSPAISFGEELRGEGEEPLTFASNFKPRIPKDDELFYFDRQTPKNIRGFTPSDLTELFLKNLISNISFYLGCRPGKAIISFPAIFTQETRLKLHHIMNKIGLKTDISNSLTEPENIALYYALSDHQTIKGLIEKQKSVIICVFDCGGGTTDVSIVRISGNPSICFEILATWGTDRFSGNYLTYLIGKHMDSEEDWFPKEFSLLYTARNDELEKYFKRIQHYEAIKCNSIGVDNDKHLYPDIEEAIRREIRERFDKINSDIMLKLFYLEITDKVEPDFIILAGNSCRLKLFDEEAKESFSGSQIIWENNTGKEAVAHGAMLYNEMKHNIEIKGSSLSQYEYKFRELFDIVEVFKPLLDMNSAHEFTSNKLKPMSIPILGKKFISDADTPDNLVIMFTIPAPEEIKAEYHYKFKLTFLKKDISYSWIAKSNGLQEESEMIKIYTEC
jgi:hypothetical protein